MKRTQIIQSLIDKINAKSYLEIGVNDGDNFNEITIDHKIGIDPWPQSAAKLKIKSDDFFLNNKEMFDIIFIDGLHNSYQVSRDIENSLKVLNQKGYIICHDMLPTTYEMQLSSPTKGGWTGDGWKSWVAIREKYDHVVMRVVDTDNGCGIINFGSQQTINIDYELNFENFEKHKQEWMNIITVDQFISDLNSD